MGSREVLEALLGHWTSLVLSAEQMTLASDVDTPQQLATATFDTVAVVRHWTRDVSDASDSPMIATKVVWLPMASSHLGATNWTPTNHFSVVGVCQSERGVETHHQVLRSP
jgi:hypothetical protein